ncbi:ABC transporter permease [Maritalea mediterranea]|uniref:ABC transporter permease n=1 Tax=Maritalea mediterranea TaxID=2909667 RepID=A0ABS9E8A9_9HYPH|nr:ABC transporter permease subunit [Maritalea mediterranea]MCF4098437.1 ABC transporter permease [Maritalea mediterranea]
MTSILSIARLELLIARRNLWVATAVLLMAMFNVVLTFAGDAPTGALGASPLTIALTSITTLSVYLVPLIALLLSFDAIVGERERGTLTLGLSYPLSRAEILIGKFLAHMVVLAIAFAIGLGLTLAILVMRHGVSVIEWGPLLRLYFTSLALGATFLGLGYMISGLVNQTGAASGVAIALWLIAVVLYDLGLLGILVADSGSAFIQTIFPYALVANPADAFRLLNTPDQTVNLLASGLGAAGSVSGLAGQLTSLLAWPLLALFLAFIAFRKVEP